MRRPTMEMLEEDLDEARLLTPAELGFSLPTASHDEDVDDDLGLRSLFEHPEMILRPSRWPHAA